MHPSGVLRAEFIGDDLFPQLQLQIQLQLLDGGYEGFFSFQVNYDGLDISVIFFWMTVAQRALKRSTRKALSTSQCHTNVNHCAWSWMRGYQLGLGTVMQDAAGRPGVLGVKFDDVDGEVYDGVVTH